jgi:hypothetical protein
MKSKIVLSILLSTMVFMIVYIWKTQKNDIMLMKHWIELIILETLVLESSHILKALITKYVKEEKE